MFGFGAKLQNSSNTMRPHGTRNGIMYFYVQCLEAAVKVLPSSLRAHFRLGSLLFAQHHFQQAADHFQYAIDLVSGYIQNGLVRYYPGVTLGTRQCVLTQRSTGSAAPQYINSLGNIQRMHSSTARVFGFGMLFF